MAFMSCPTCVYSTQSLSDHNTLFSPRLWIPMNVIGRYFDYHSDRKSGEGESIQWTGMLSCLQTVEDRAWQWIYRWFNICRIFLLFLLEYHFVQGIVVAYVLWVFWYTRISAADRTSLKRMVSDSWRLPLRRFRYGQITLGEIPDRDRVESEVWTTPSLFLPCVTYAMVSNF